VIARGQANGGRRMSRIIIAALAVIAGGCSSYHAVKLDSRGPIPHGTKASAIVTLPRPEFVVKKVEGADSAQYQVDVAYVPDLEQRYAISMASSPFASVDLDFIYAENGTLSSTGATVKDEAAPTILGLFKVAAAVMGVTGTGGFAAAYVPPAQLDGCFTQSDRSGSVNQAYCAIDLLAVNQECKPVAAALKDRLLPYVAADGMDKAPGLGTLFARDDKERKCLEFVGKEVDKLLTIKRNVPLVSYVPTGLHAEFNTAFDNDEAKHPPATADNIAEQISKYVEEAIAAGDVDAIKRLAYVAGATSTPSGLVRFDALLGGGVEPKQGDATRVVRVLDETKLYPKPGSQSGLDRVRAIARMTIVKKGLAEAQSLEPTAWRARYITAKQRELAQKEQALLAANLTVNVHEHKDTLALRREVASLAGVRSEFERARGFRKLLDRVPSKASATDYEEYRKQLVSLEQTVNTAIAAAMTTESKQAKKVDKLPPRSPWVSDDCITQSRQEAWRYIRTSDAPRFVVVLRRADGTALAPRNNGSNACTL